MSTDWLAEKLNGKRTNKLHSGILLNWDWLKIKKVWKIELSNWTVLNCTLSINKIIPLKYEKCPMSRFIGDTYSGEENKEKWNKKNHLI